MKFQRVAFIFPGQGAQYVGMGKECAEQFPVAKRCFEEADDVLGERLSHITFEGPSETLNETRYSQLAIFVTSIALMRVLQQECPLLAPFACAGLSLGEYSALTASNHLSFAETLPLVKKRGALMNQACLATKGGMAVVLGMQPDEVIALVEELKLPQDLWVANFNCPGQVVLSGTQKGIDAGMAAAKERGAKRVLPLTVHGAFHSGLMQSAEKQLAPFVEKAPIQESTISLFANVTGEKNRDLAEIKRNLTKQVTHSVKWQMCVEALQREGVDLFIEIGPGKSLSGMNRKIGVSAPTKSLEKVDDLQSIIDSLEE